MLDRTKGDADADAYKGQYISAGYTGHGMPKAYAWYVESSIQYSVETLTNSDIQRRSRRIHDRRRHQERDLEAACLAARPVSDLEAGWADWALIEVAMLVWKEIFP